MARKMIFIFFIMVPSLENSRKIVYLLFFSAISLYLTIKHFPYTQIKLNIIEKYSNWAALTTIFAGGLYEYGVNELIKTLGFIGILFINIKFISFWSLTFFGIVLRAYKEKLVRFCPRIFIAFSSLQKALNQTRIGLNLKKSTREFRNNYMYNSRKLRKKILLPKFKKRLSSFLTIN